MARKPDGADRSRWERFADEVGRKEARKIRGRAERRRSAWFWAGMFGLVGWSVAIPTLLGLYLGVTLDDWVPGPASWTLTGLLVGLAVGCLNAWYWVRRESRREE